MTDFRAMRLLMIAVTFAACSADVPKAPRGAAAPDRSAASVPSSTVDSTAGEPATEPSAKPQPGAEVMTADGWGPLRIGMTVAEITAALGPDANPGAVGGPDPGQCDEFRPENAPEGILVMVQRGVLTRISVSRNETIRTPEGLRIGDPEADVLAAYGTRARIEPHPYWPSPAKSITVWHGPRVDANPRGIRFEIDAKGNVAHLRAGGPSIEAIEGCV